MEDPSQTADDLQLRPSDLEDADASTGHEPAPQPDLLSSTVSAPVADEVVAVETDALSDLAADVTAPFHVPLLDAADNDASDETTNTIPTSGAWWTLPLMCFGIGLVACAILIPAADENRRAAYELSKIQSDVDYFQKQSDTNKDFLEKVANDPTLAERLAMRQLRLTRPNTLIVRMPQKDDPFSMSPYALVSVDPPQAFPEYQPIAGKLGEIFRNTRWQLYLTGLGLLCTAAALILGGGQPRPEIIEDPATI